MTDDAKPPSPNEEEERAIDYIARTPEGRLLHRYLRRVLEAAPDLLDLGALPSIHGRRTLARDLMRLMKAGIEDTGSKRDGHADDAILTGNRKPAGIGGHPRGTGRRVNADTITGYDGPTDVHRRSS